MTLFRAFLLRHRAFAAVLVAMALCLKAAVPAGYMVGQQSRMMTVLVCDPSGTHGTKMQVAIPVKDDGGSKAAKAKAECPWSGLSLDSAPGMDPALLALAIAFILALGFAPVRIPALRRTARALPPACGPPALA